MNTMAQAINEQLSQLPFEELAKQLDLLELEVCVVRAEGLRWSAFTSWAGITEPHLPVANNLVACCCCSRSRPIPKSLRTGRTPCTCLGTSTTRTCKCGSPPCFPHDGLKCLPACTPHSHAHLLCRTDARFLWKRIPASAKQVCGCPLPFLSPVAALAHTHTLSSQLRLPRMIAITINIPTLSTPQNNPELDAAWKLLQFFWCRQYQGMWQALQGYQWSAAVQPIIDALTLKTRDEMLDLIGTAYHTVKPEKVAKLVGLTQQEALKVCLLQGWQYEDATGVLTVRGQRR